MTLNKDTRILIVGLGLMGGSYAKALTRRGYRVSAITKEQSSVDYALREDVYKRQSAYSAARRLRSS